MIFDALANKIFPGSSLGLGTKFRNCEELYLFNK